MPALDAPEVAHIAPSLRSLAVQTGSLVSDPRNARAHDARNLAAIESSLRAAGQVKPLVVRRATMHVIAGNGTLEVARRIGWGWVAAVILDIDEAAATRLALADNRTAELAEWDWAQLSETLREIGAEPVADLWSEKELELLLQDVWTPPTPIADNGPSVVEQPPRRDRPGEVTLKIQPDEVALSLTREEWEDAVDALATLSEQYAEGAARLRAMQVPGEANEMAEIAKRASALAQKIEGATRAQEPKA